MTTHGQYHFVLVDPHNYASDAPGHWCDRLNGNDPHDSEPLANGWSTWAEAILADQAGWCDCIDLIRVLPLMREYLTGHWGRFDQTIIQFDRDDPLQTVVAAIADQVQFTEHGGNIGGSWLRPEGRRWLALLERDGPHPEEVSDA